MLIYTMNKVIIKIGSGTLLTKRGKLDEFHLAHIAGQVRKLHDSGMGVILVISGAVAYGVEHLRAINNTTTSRQVAAGIGQIAVISAIQRLFAEKDLIVAQLLLTSHTLNSDEERKKVREVLDHYLWSGIVAVINENDVVDLNGFGGNDLLAAHIAQLVDAHQVLILSQMTRSVHGVGGGETKRLAIETLEKEGIRAQIINGRDKDVILENIL